jgi:hypothetical protein
VALPVRQNRLFAASPVRPLLIFFVAHCFLFSFAGSNSRTIIIIVLGVNFLPAALAAIAEEFQPVVLK